MWRSGARRLEPCAAPPRVSTHPLRGLATHDRRHNDASNPSSSASTGRPPQYPGARQAVTITEMGRLRWNHHHHHHNQTRPAGPVNPNEPSESPAAAPRPGPAAHAQRRRACGRGAATHGCSAHHHMCARRRGRLLLHTKHAHAAPAPPAARRRRAAAAKHAGASQLLLPLLLQNAHGPASAAAATAAAAAANGVLMLAARHAQVMCCVQRPGTHTNSIAAGRAPHTRARHGCGQPAVGCAAARPCMRQHAAAGRAAPCCKHC